MTEPQTELMQQIKRLLPEYLSERCRVAHPGRFTETGGILYWMCTAVRAEENPALDVAIVLAHETRRPLLVYHALSEQYPFASDRHHTFILEAARDVQQMLLARGIPYVFHLERPGSRGDHLRTLANQAAVVITEDMPVAPPASFLAGLASRTETAIIAVDTACVCPMQLVGRAWDRAFQFREAVSRLHHERLLRPWPVLAEHSAAWEPRVLPFTPLDLSSASIPDLVGDCRIDHAVGPVLDTHGGTTAGMARWNTFRQQGLRHYADRRNNPLEDGVSRMSAWLHYGMVSPLRIAREAAELKHDGASKYLDELLIWRELAWCFCRYRSDFGNWSAIPRWAQQTLLQHAGDPRPALYTWEQLAAGETRDPLWNAAQKSLRIHGELHNNVRMTWGKALLQWTADPRKALQLIIDLNHRYALDGRDPASYGGILWCLGQFDRPFTPEQPVLGTVRPRPTSEHARRLDPVVWSRRTSVTRANPVPRIAIIGGGISGAAAARTLADHALPVTVFDKSRSAGGRMAGRRIGDYRFDHGAPAFHARDKAFRRLTRSWVEAGVAAVWEGPWMQVDASGVWRELHSRKQLAAIPGMTAAARHLLHGIPLEPSRRIVQLEQDSSSGGWLLYDDSGVPAGPFDQIIVALPAPQAADLLAAVQPTAASVIRQLPYAVIRTLMAGYAVPLEELCWNVAVAEGPVLGRIIRSHTRPRGLHEQSDCRECLVLHSTADWGAAHSETDARTVCEAMLNEFQRLLGRQLPQPDVTEVHRWKFAEPLGVLSCVRQPEAAAMIQELHAAGIGLSGDWLVSEEPGCCGVETAWQSGVNAAGRVLRGLRREVRVQRALW